MSKKIVIFSGSDATGKTTRAKFLKEKGYHLSVLKQEIDITKLSIIENIEKAIKQGKNYNENIVMDRSLIDLLAYYYVNDKNCLEYKGNGIGSFFQLRSILKTFIESYSGATFYYLVASNEVIKKRLLKRKTSGIKLSANDLKIINKDGYLDSFIAAFEKIMKILENTNKRIGNLITIEKIDTTDMPNPTNYETSI